MDESPSFDAAAVLKDLRSARRRRRVADFDPFEALYRAYLTGILLAIAVLALSSITGDGKLTAAEVTRVRLHGGPAIGMVVGLAFAIGFRSGGRGGPLVVEAADVRHVLLSPVDRSRALRGPAIRQLRFLILVGGGAGTVGGLLALRRLPGVPAAWMASGAVVGAAAVAGGFGLAMITSGRRLGRWIGGLLALAMLAWSFADLRFGHVTSPATFLGRLALWPLVSHPVDLVGLLIAVVAVAAGLAVIGGTSLEASERRASLVGQIRFAATLQDLRTVIVLRRQLAQELPRQRPWLRMPRSIPPTPGVRARDRRLPVWRRGWHGILRWPAMRYVRVATLGAVAGLALVGVWNGTTPLLVVAGLALYIAGLDATEALAQEIDHPDRSDSYDLPAGELHLRQLGPPAVIMILVAGIGLLAAAAATGGSTTTWEVGAVMILPASLCGLGAATVSVIKGPPPALSSQTALMPEAAGARAMGRLLWPPIMAVLGVLPVLAARDAFKHGHPVVAATIALGQPVTILVIGFFAWVRYQSDARAWFANQMEELTTAAKPGPSQG